MRLRFSAAGGKSDNFDSFSAVACLLREVHLNERWAQRPQQVRNSLEVTAVASCMARQTTSRSESSCELARHTDSVSASLTGRASDHGRCFCATGT